MTRSTRRPWPLQLPQATAPARRRARADRVGLRQKEIRDEVQDWMRRQNRRFKGKGEYLRSERVTETRNSDWSDPCEQFAGCRNDPDGENTEEKTNIASGDLGWRAAGETPPGSGCQHHKGECT